MIWCYVVGGILGAIVILHSLIEIHYFLRLCLAVIIARFFKKRVNILDTTSVSGICLSTDIDTLLNHMNNTRYFRELDFARADFYERTELYRTIIRSGGAVVQGAATIRYRRYIKTFSRFQLTSKIVYWDNQSIFMEHRFISPVDGFVHCILLCRQRVINCSAEDIMNELLGQNERKMSKTIERVENGHRPDTGKIKPEMSLEVSKWMEWNDISSAILRNDC